jgi:hypothetical protein
MESAVEENNDLRNHSALFEIEDQGEPPSLLPSLSVTKPNTNQSENNLKKHNFAPGGHYFVPDRQSSEYQSNQN